MILADMSARKRHDTLWLTLGFVLEDLPAAADTREVCDCLMIKLHSDENRLIARWLIKVAHLVPEASHTGASFEKMGKVMQRWVWNPRGRLAKLGAAPHILTPDQVAARAEAARLQALVETATDVDDSDW